MIAYIIKSSISLILLFGLYWFLLRKEKLFVFNRFFLLLSVIFSLILPLISIPVYFQTIHEPENIIPAHNYVIPEISKSENFVSGEINSDQSAVVIQPSGIDLPAILMVIYLSGTILFFLRFLKNIYSISHRIKLSEKIRFKGYRLILINEDTNPYCFFNNIFINRDDYLNFRIDNQLLNHELEHIRQYHSLDIVFIELIKIFYWFNPVHLLYDRAIRINHEYLADNGVISYDCDIQSYMNKLISFIIGRSNIPLTSGSNHSFTKKRLLMMTKTKSGSSVHGLRIATTLTLILVFSLFISFKQSYKQPSDKEADSAGWTYSQQQTVKDIEGNVYKTVTIGNYVWMAENLKTTRYNDGKKIPLVPDVRQWQKYEQGYCWYNNDKSENENKYGALYNWYAVGTNKLCPAGWHVPHKSEFMSLINFPALDTITGGKLKEAGTAHWRIPNKEATNETGFTALPGGYRGMDGEFGRAGEIGQWWTSLEENEYIGLCWGLTYKDGRVGPGVSSKRYGLSVRCIKDYSDATYNSSFKSPEIIQNVVRGIVETEDGKRLIGAVIITVGSNNYSSRLITSSDGRFTTNNLQAGASLLIECPGFKSQTLKADLASEMVVRLVRDPDYKGKIIINEIQNVNFRNSDFTPAKALVVIDGAIIDYKSNLKVNPGEIKSFKILTDKEATDKYGEKGKDGVVEITLYGNNTGSAGKKPVGSKITSDTSKYITHLNVNHVAKKEEIIDIPIADL